MELHGILYQFNISREHRLNLAYNSQLLYTWQNRCGMHAGEGSPGLQWTASSLKASESHFKSNASSQLGSRLTNPFAITVGPPLAIFAVDDPIFLMLIPTANLENVK